MAETLKGPGKGRKKKGDDGGEPKPRKDHNTAGDQEALEGFYKRLDNLHDAFASASGEFRSDVKQVLEEAAGELDIPRSVLRHDFAARRAEAKRKKKEAGFEASERESLERIRAALGDLADTPLGQTVQH